MANPFANAQSSDQVEKVVDNVGSDFSALDTGIYRARVDAAFLRTAASEAVALEMRFTLLDENNTELREYESSAWMISGKAKGNKTYYLTKDKPPKHVSLPGYVIASDLALMAGQNGKPIEELETVTKSLPVYNANDRKRVPTEVQVYPDLEDGIVYLAIEKRRENKTVNDGSGTYVPTADTRETNEIIKVLHRADKRTVTEMLEGAEANETAFAHTWEAKNKGVTRDLVKDVPAAATQGAPAALGGTPAATSAPAKSIFGGS